jgi:hypothetical protein
MTDTAGHDIWAQGTGYERYIGRWSRPVAAEFLKWLAIPPGKKTCQPLGTSDRRSVRRGRDLLASGSRAHLERR